MKMDLYITLSAIAQLWLIVRIVINWKSDFKNIHLMGLVGLLLAVLALGPICLALSIYFRVKDGNFFRLPLESWEGLIN